MITNLETNLNVTDFRHSFFGNFLHLFFLVYYVGSELGYSSTFYFKTEPDDFKPQVAIFGDLGYKGAVSVPYLQNEVHNNTLDMIIHAGDFAYDLDDVSGSLEILNIESVS